MTGKFALQRDIWGLYRFARARLWQFRLQQVDSMSCQEDQRFSALIVDR
jgi:hypothetical protein